MTNIRTRQADAYVLTHRTYTIYFIDTYFRH